MSRPLMLKRFGWQVTQFRMQTQAVVDTYEVVSLICRSFLVVGIEPKKLTGDGQQILQGQQQRFSRLDQDLLSVGLLW